MPWIAIAATAAVLLFVVATGVWRFAFRPFCINAARMTPEKLGFAVRGSADRELVRGVCNAFAGGFNAMIAAPQGSAWKRYTDQLPVKFRPFADEGAAMGYPLRRLGRFAPSDFERDVVDPRRAYVYLHYVGLGFWSAMRDHKPERLQRVVDALDPLHGMLCWDGYGFKLGFFDFPRESYRQTRLERLAGYARNVAYQGMGRSLWFRFMDEPDELVERIRSFGPYAADAASGIGLAAVFTTVDRPERGYGLLAQMPAEWQDDIQVGMCFAYKARSINDPEFFESCLDMLEAKRQAAIRTAIDRCDRIEADVRASGGDYRQWRESLRSWLGAHIRYPLEAVVSGGADVDRSDEAVGAMHGVGTW